MNEPQDTVSNVEPIQPEPTVSFPDPHLNNDQGGFPKWIFAVIGLVIILAGGGFFLYQTSNAPASATPSPTPYVSGLDTLPSPSETPLVSTTPSPVATASPSQKGLLSIEVQNGTGTTGDAALAKSILTKAGYTKVTTANATNQAATETTIVYSSDVSLSLVSDLTSVLSQNFASVKSQSGSGKMIVTVITGPKATGTAKATSTPKPSASPVTTH